jgi:hypothetical protein
LTTVVLIPFLSLIVVDWQTVPRISRDYWDIVNGSVRIAWKWSWQVRAKTGSLLTATVLSILLALRSWKYRPQLASRPVTEKKQEEVDDQA